MEGRKIDRYAPNIDDVKRLGETLRALRWPHVEEVREIYRRFRSDSHTKSDVERVEWFEALVGLGPAPLETSQMCPGCAKRGAHNDWSGVRVAFNFPDRHVCECAGCRKQWLRMHKRDR